MASSGGWAKKIAAISGRPASVILPRHHRIGKMKCRARRHQRSYNVMWQAVHSWRCNAREITRKERKIKPPQSHLITKEMNSGSSASYIIGEIVSRRAQRRNHHLEAPLPRIISHNLVGRRRGIVVSQYCCSRAPGLLPLPREAAGRRGVSSQSGDIVAISTRGLFDDESRQ